MGRLFIDKLTEAEYHTMGGYRSNIHMWQSEAGLPVEIELRGHHATVSFDADLENLEKLKVAIDYAISNYNKPEEEPKHFYKVKQSAVDIAMAVLSGGDSVGWLCKETFGERYFINNYTISLKDRVALTEKEFGKAIEGNTWLGEILEKVEVE